MVKVKDDDVESALKGFEIFAKSQRKVRSQFTDIAVLQIS